MAEIITPRYGHIPQAEAYPPEEWTWRGIIYPGVFEGTTSFIQYKFDSIKIDLATGAAYYTNYGTDGLYYNAPVINATQNGPGSILVDGTTDIDTGFKPNIATYSIEETITGELQDFGSDISDTSSRVSDGRLTSYSFNSGDNHATLEDDAGTSDGYLILRFTVNIGSTYLVTMNTDIANTPSSDTYRPKLDDNQGTSNIFSGGGTLNTMSCEITAVETIIRLSLYANDVTIAYENISVKELTTKTQRTEQRLLTHTDAIPETKYYINGIEQAVTPALPDPLVDINLNNIAITGYPDTIDGRLGNFEIHNEVIIP